MTFNKIDDGGTKCSCIDGKSYEDIENIYTRKLLGSHPVDADFASYWELNKKPKNLNNCHKVCSHKGVSVNLFTDVDTKRDTNKITTDFAPLQNKFNTLCIFKFLKDAGMFMWENNHQFTSHRNFFKDDCFTVDKSINIVGIEKL